MSTGWIDDRTLKQVLDSAKELEKAWPGMPVHVEAQFIVAVLSELQARRLEEQKR